MSTESMALDTIACFIQAMLYMGLEVHTAVIWNELLPTLQISIGRVCTKQIDNNSVKPWDASASNFVLISTNVGMHAELIYSILHQYRYCNLEMVEQVITAAGFMAWSPS